MTPMTWAFMFLIGSLVATRFCLNETFPYPEVGAMSDVDMDSASLKVWILHRLIYVGVFLVGMLGIQHNGKSFVDDASRLNL